MTTIRNCALSFARPFHRPRLAAVGLATLLAAGLLAGCGGGGDDAADDDAAKLVRNQTSGSCDAPPLPPTTLTPLGLNPLGIATLTAQPEPGEGQGQPSDQVAAEVEAAARNFVNCWNQRRFEAVVALTTEDWHKGHYVLKNPSDLIFASEGSPDIPFTMRTLEDLQTHEDGRVSLYVEYLWVTPKSLALVLRERRWPLALDHEERSR